MENLYDVLLEQLKDLYSAETQLTDALPEMAEGAESEELKAAFTNHLEETNGQIKRLEKISSILQEELTGHTCQAMKGLIKEGSEALEEDYDAPGLKDVMLVSAAQRVEHYEIAGYGNAIALAGYLGMDDVVELLEQTIEQEGNADKTLTTLCETQLFDACESGYEDDEDEDDTKDLAEDDEDDDSRAL